jgi:hypothetical protein
MKQTRERAAARGGAASAVAKGRRNSDENCGELGFGDRYAGDVERRSSAAFAAHIYQRAHVRSYLGPLRRKEKEKLEMIERSMAAVDNYRLSRRSSKSCVAELMP